MIFQTSLEKNMKEETDYIYKTVKRKKQAYCGHCNKIISPDQYANVFYHIVSVNEQFNYDGKKIFLHNIRSVGISCLDETCKNEYLKIINDKDTNNFKPAK